MKNTLGPALPRPAFSSQLTRSDHPPPDKETQFIICFGWEVCGRLGPALQKMWDEGCRGPLPNVSETLRLVLTVH